ncbi:MAG: HAD hydrolase family protein [Candidatus Marinimicrobia bacterium]|nr:HAD hydrolase family protein [Candidatus Neomarinimicrobiota bacterium]
MEDRIKKIKLLILDVDGVFTNGAFYINGSGKEYKKFCARDGLGIGLMKAVKFPLAIISGKHSEATSYRMHELGITEDVFQGKHNKIESYNIIKAKYELGDDEIAYIGDDLIDLPILQKVGAAFTVPHASQDVQVYCDYITKNSGGQGAVREIIDLILKGQGKFKKAKENLLDYKTGE